MKQTAFTLVLLCIFFSTSFGQSVEKKEMAKLSFMIGDWKGEGSSLPQNENQPYTALTKVRYDLDGEMIVLRLRSTRDGKEVLSLHTIIYYSDQDKCYYYYPFTKKGVRPFKGELVDGKLICHIGDTYRLVFQRNSDGQFQEYGEKLKEGKWVKNFEDKLWPTSEITTF